MNAEENPVPVRRTLDRTDYLDLAIERALMLRRYTSWAAYTAPQELISPICHASSHDEVTAPRTDRLVTRSVARPVPGVAAPHTVGVVECAEGPWVLVRLFDTGHASQAAGVGLELVVRPSGVEGGGAEALVAGRSVRQVA
jgi:uncharacterized OB-fold protein